MSDDTPKQPKIRYIVRLTVLKTKLYYGMWGRITDVEWVKDNSFENSIVFYTKLQLHNFLIKVKRSEQIDDKDAKSDSLRFIIHNICEFQQTKEFYQDDFDKMIGPDWED